MQNKHGAGKEYPQHACPVACGIFFTAAGRHSFVSLVIRWKRAKVAHSSLIWVTSTRGVEMSRSFGEALQTIPKFLYDLSQNMYGFHQPNQHGSSPALHPHRRSGHVRETMVSWSTPSLPPPILPKLRGRAFLLSPRQHASPSPPHPMQAVDTIATAVFIIAAASIYSNWQRLDFRATIETLV